MALNINSFLTNSDAKEFYQKVLTICRDIEEISHLSNINPSILINYIINTRNINSKIVHINIRKTLINTKNNNTTHKRDTFTSIVGVLGSGSRINMPTASIDDLQSIKWRIARYGDDPCRVYIQLSIHQKQLLIMANSGSESFASKQGD